MVKDQLAQIGGDITIGLAEPVSATAEIRAFKYDWTKSYCTPHILDADELATFALVSDARTNAVRTGYKNDEIDKLALDAQSQLEPEKRKQMYFFFSSRRRHTRCLSDWSSDVCSSD